MAGIDLPSELELELKYIVEIGASPEGEGVFTVDGRGSTSLLESASSTLDALEDKDLIISLVFVPSERVCALTPAGEEIYQRIVSLYSEE